MHTIIAPKETAVITQRKVKQLNGDKFIDTYFRFGQTVEQFHKDFLLVHTPVKIQSKVIQSNIKHQHERPFINFNSHNDPFQNIHAVDFLMPVGTRLYSVLDGTVVSIVVA